MDNGEQVISITVYTLYYSYNKYYRFFWWPQDGVMVAPCLQQKCWPPPPPPGPWPATYPGGWRVWKVSPWVVCCTWLVSIIWEGGVGGNFPFSGGGRYGNFSDDIYQWTGADWEEVGKMKMARSYHAVSTIRLDDDAIQYCAWLVTILVLRTSFHLSINWQI